MQHHARIEVARAGAHHQPVERGEPHGRIDAAPVRHGAEAGAVAEMRGDHPPGGEPRRQDAQPPGDEFVREAVEAVAADPGLGQRARQGEAGRELRHRVMEAGVETGHLRQVRPGRGDRTDRRQVVRLVQWRERDERGERRQDRLGHQHRAVEPRPAMHHPMADGAQRRPSSWRADEAEQGAEQVLVRAALREAPVHQRRPRGVVGEEPRRAADPLDLAMRGARQPIPLAGREQRELDGGGAGVERQDRAARHGRVAFPLRAPALPRAARPLPVRPRPADRP